jgi:hypothetical protein
VLRVSGLSFMVYDLISGSGYRVYGIGIRAHGLGFEI